MLTHVGLFEGSGIPSLAAAACGIKTVAYSEVDPACCFCLARLWPEAVNVGDVKTADWSQVPHPVFILTAGVPCQPVSTAGKQKGANDERWLWPETIRAVREIRPAWLLFENPSAIILHGLERIVAELEGFGYEFIPKGPDGRFTPLRVGAWAVGAPHKRDRAWIVAHREGIGRPKRGLHQGRTQKDGHGTPDALRVSEGMGHSSCPYGGIRREWEKLKETVADATQQREREQDNEECPEPQSGDARQDAGWRSGGELADIDSPRLPLAVGDRGRVQQEQTQAAVRCRWPARPGEPQHAWEAPRLVEFGLGGPASGLARRIHERLDGSGNGISPDRAASRANKTLLKMCGNSWVYPLAVLMFRAIRELDREML